MDGNERAGQSLRLCAAAASLTRSPLLNSWDCGQFIAHNPDSGAVDFRQAFACNYSSCPRPTSASFNARHAGASSPCAPPIRRRTCRSRSASDSSIVGHVLLLLEGISLRPEHFFNGSPAPSPECHRKARAEARTESTKLIAAAVIAAIRLNKETIENSPAVHSKVAESLKLADMIVAKMKNVS